MALKIIKEDEPLEIDSIMVVIFGEPGIGKTSLGFTCDNPLLEDYDGGVQRAVKRKTTVKVDSWEDAIEFHQSGQLEEMGVKTLIIDTVGTMLDNFIATSVIKNDSKNAKKDGSLGLSGYGAMKNVFNSFVNDMRSKKIDVLFIAHDDEKDEDGYTKKRPKVTGGSYDILKGSADLVGYMYTENNKRVLSFEPCDKHVGKNSAQIEKQIVPVHTEKEHDGFMGRIFEKCKKKMAEMSETQKEALKKLDEYRGYIEKCANLDELIMLEADIMEMSTVYRVQLMKVYDDKYISLYKDMVNAVEYTIDLDEVFNKAKEIPKRLAPPIKSIVNKCMEQKGFKYDKDAGMVVDEAGKQTFPPNEEKEGQKKAEASNDKESKDEADTKKSEPEKQKDSDPVKDSSTDESVKNFESGKGADAKQENENVAEGKLNFK